MYQFYPHSLDHKKYNICFSQINPFILHIVTSLHNFDKGGLHYKQSSRHGKQIFACDLVRWYKIESKKKLMNLQF